MREMLNILDMVKLHFNKTLLKPTSELVILSPLVKDKFVGESRFKDAIPLGGEYVQYSDIENCDYVVLPYKWDRRNPNNTQIIDEAKSYNKKVLIFHIDDSDEDINVDSSYVFRTSFYRSKQKSYERSLPCFKDDTFEGRYIQDPKMNIGFCGQIITPLRRLVISQLEKSKIETNFIIRKIAWPGIENGKTKAQVVKEFYQNMDKNVFNLCIRGGGNFSYRVYETMMMGRIPIIIDSDLVLPFEGLIDWERCSVFIKDVNSMVRDIENFYLNNNLFEMQKNNRKIWENYLSPIGVIKNFHKVL